MVDLVTRIFGRREDRCSSQRKEKTVVTADRTVLENLQAIEVSPTLAQEWLTEYDYPRQRPLRPAHVLEITQLLQQSRFQATPMVLAYCQEAGRTYLVDGRHRLTAIVRSGIAQTLYVISERCQTEEEVYLLYSRLDRGAPRTQLDVLRAAGIAVELDLPPTFIASISGALPLIQTGFQSTLLSQVQTRIAEYRVDGFREWSPEICLLYQLSKGQGATRWMRRVLTAGPVSIALITLRFQPDLARVFWSSVLADDGLRKGTPEKTLVDFVQIGTKSAMKGMKGKPSVFMARGVNLCWNAAYAGRSLSFIRVMGSVRIAGTPYST